MLGCNLKEALHFSALIFFFNEAHKILSLNANVLKSYVYSRFSQYISKYVKYTFLGYDFWILLPISSNKWHPSIIMLSSAASHPSHCPKTFQVTLPSCLPLRWMMSLSPLGRGGGNVATHRVQWHGMQVEPRHIVPSGKLWHLGYTWFPPLVASNVELPLQEF